MGDGFYRSKDPTQSTEGESCKGKQPKNHKENTNYRYTNAYIQNSIQIQHTEINTASPLVNRITWGD